MSSRDFHTARESFWSAGPPDNSCVRRLGRRVGHIGCVPSVQLQPEAAQVQVGTSQPEGCKHVADVAPPAPRRPSSWPCIARKTTFAPRTHTAGGNTPRYDKQQRPRKSTGLAAPTVESFCTKASRRRLAANSSPERSRPSDHEELLARGFPLLGLNDWGCVHGCHVSLL